VIKPKNERRGRVQKTNTLFSTGIMDKKKKKYNEVFGGDSVRSPINTHRTHIKPT
jgi:hypothetical protein